MIDERLATHCFGGLKARACSVSEWREEDKRNKRFLSPFSDGEQLLGQLLKEWQAIDSSSPAFSEGTSWNSSIAILQAV